MIKTKQMKNFQYLLQILDACLEARSWAADRTIEQVVAECHRGDWLLWLAARINVDNRKMGLAAGKCAETVIHLMTDERSKAGVKAAIDYGEERISGDELNAAAAYADAAADAARAAYAHTAAAAAAADAAAYAARAAYAHTAADAYAAAHAAAYAENQKQTADIVRGVIGSEIIEKVNARLHD